MKTIKRWDQIVNTVDQRTYVTVTDLSEQFDVSEMTIRRDLEQLAKLKRVQRIYGGAASLRTTPAVQTEAENPRPLPRSEISLFERVDVIVAASLDPKYDIFKLDASPKKKIPIIAEAQPEAYAESCVSVDNHAAAYEIGVWVGDYANQHWDGKARVLDLTYQLSNTRARSQGFMDGLRQAAPKAELTLSLNPQSRYNTAYQMTRDALLVYKDINIIFAINDTNAWGAIQACKDTQIDPGQILVVPFGLEGDTLKNALIAGEYCQAGLAMFPEYAGRACVDAAIAAYQRQVLPEQIVTPHAILTRETLTTYYTFHNGHWQISWEAMDKLLAAPLRNSSDVVDVAIRAIRPGRNGFSESSSQIKPDRDLPLPLKIGFIVRFTEHEWYRNLSAAMKAHAREYKIGFVVIDAEQSIRDEVELRRQEIARLAVEEVQPGDVLLIDGGVITLYLAEALKNRENVTVITNSLAVFDILKNSAELVLISTGGAYRRSTQMLVGPTAEGALSELRADKLFLTVSGVSLDFGLSYSNISEITMKQAMIRSAREVILLVDYTCFGQDSTAQVASLNAVHKLITDDAIPVSYRLELNRLGVQVRIASL